MIIIWTLNFQINRSSKVIINDTSIEDLIVSIGVAQGSVQGSLLFLSYINHLSDIFTCDDNLHFLLFADDAKLIQRIRTIDGQVSLQSLIKNLINGVVNGKLKSTLINAPIRVLILPGFQYNVNLGTVRG